jgi:hypothetical protein
LTPTDSGSPPTLLAICSPRIGETGSLALTVSLRCVADLAAIERELSAARLRDDNDARIRLIPQALALPDAKPDRAEYLDELAYAYQQLGRFEDAIDAMREAVAAGWNGTLDDHPSAQALIADLLLHAGRDHDADQAWQQAQREDPENPRIYQAAGSAYADVGADAKALPWQTTGLQLALADGTNDDLIWMLTGERADSLDALGQPPDDLQLRAEELVDRQEQQEQARVDAFYRERATPRPIPPHRASVGLAWFPVTEYPGAPNLAQLRRGLRQRALRRVLRPTRTTAQRPQSPRRRTARADPAHDRRLPRLVHQPQPRPRTVREPGQLRDRTHGTRHQPPLAARTQRVMLVRQPTQIQEVLPTRAMTRSRTPAPHPPTTAPEPSKTPKVEVP